MDKKKFWQFRATTNEENTGDLLLYGEISSSSWWGDEVTPQQFKQDLDALGDITALNVFINSPGGDVFASQAIYSMLIRCAAQVNVYIDGLAASGASLIAMAGDTIIMPKNAMMMIHNAWTIAVGNANSFRKLADDLDKIQESMIAVYQAKTGMESDKIAGMLDAETWMTADEAVSNGFADEIEAEKAIAASISGGFMVINGQKMDLSRFKNPPKLAFLPVIQAPKQPEKPPETPPSRLAIMRRRLDLAEKLN